MSVRTNLLPGVLFVAVDNKGCKQIKTANSTLQDMTGNTLPFPGHLGLERVQRHSSRSHDDLEAKRYWG